MSESANGRRSPLGAPFWRLFVSSSTSNLSDGVLQAALPLLAATLTRDPIAVSALAALAFLPWLLFALPAGTLVDRVNRRTAMAVANVFRAGLLALMATAVLTGIATLPLLYATAFLLGCAETVYDSAARAMLPAVIGKQQLERGNSLLTTGESVGNIFLGAPVGAWLFAIAASIPLWTNAFAYLIAAALIVTVTGKFATARTEKTSVRHDMAVALRWLRHHQILRSLMITTGISGLLQSMISGILVLFALQNLDLSERGFGILLAVAGVGAVIGSLLSPLLTARLGRTAAMGACEVASSAAVVVMGVWQHPVVGMVCFAISAGAISAFNVQIMSVRQALIPEHMFGRVQGAYRTVIWGGIPLGSLAGGALGRQWGLPAVFICSGALGIVAGLVTWAILRRHRAAIAAAFETETDSPVEAVEAESVDVTNSTDDETLGREPAGPAH
jgi:predicted MFS family arabinose efflux permease